MLKLDSTYNKNILKIITNQQSVAEGSYGADWWYKKSLFYKINSSLRAICLLFTAFVNYLILSNYSMRMAETSQASVRAIYKTAYNSFLIGTILLLVAFVVLKVSGKLKWQIKATKNLHLISLIVAIVASVLLGVTAYNVLVGANISNMYAEAVESSTSLKIYLQLCLAHVLPLLIVCYTFLMSFIMAKRDFNEKNTMYNNLTEKLYREFTKENPQFTEQTWQEYLNAYTEN